MSDEDAMNVSNSVLRNGTNKDNQNGIQAANSNNTTTRDEGNIGRGSNANDGEKLDKEKSRHSSGLSTHSSEYEYLEAAVVNEDRIAQVMAEIKIHHYSPSDDKHDRLGLVGECTSLFRKDYNITIVDNSSGHLSSNYPKEIIIPIGETKSNTNIEFDKDQYVKLVADSSVTRSRSRFVVPVILCDNKFICRSGTVGNILSTAYETAKRNSKEGSLSTFWQRWFGVFSDIYNVALYKTMAMIEAFKVITANDLTPLMEKDAEVMRMLRIRNIYDLMVENAKKAVFRILPVSSSEKVNQAIYEGFKILWIPFAGCEFFEYYHNANRKPEGLVFTLKEPGDDTPVKCSSEGVINMELEVHDLIETTKKYMTKVLNFIAGDSNGLVIHCISGWDRTPLFISLVRVSLWADGVIHASLNSVDMAYLTLAYDWYLFGHDFPTRYSRNEEIMHFCFHIMQYITSDDFSVTRMFQELSAGQKKNRTFPAFKPETRYSRMMAVSSLLLGAYDEKILNKVKEKADSSFEEISMPSETSEEEKTE